MTSFWYGKIQVDRVSKSSVVSYGENLQAGFTATKKVNEGFGGVLGRSNMLLHNIQFVNDADEVDAWRSRIWAQRDET